MNKDDLVRLKHMLDAGHEAIGFMQNRDRHELLTNRMLQLAQVRLLEIIGEAARAVSPEFRDAHPEINWKGTIGMRDRLIHGYYRVDLNIVWEALTEDLPSLVKALEIIVTE